MFWYSRTNNPGRTSTELIEAWDQCEKTPDSKALGRLTMMKDTFDKSLEDILVDLSEINVDSVSGFIPSPTADERTRITT